MRTVEKLWHVIPRERDVYEVPSYAVFNRVEAGRMVLLSPQEVRLLCNHLRSSNPGLERLGWCPPEEDSSKATGPDFELASVADARNRVLRSIVQRQGQGEFRNALLAAYGGRCCISGCEAVPVLEAAHILPYQGTDTNRVQNGLLLRADLHTLFDLGLLSIEPETYTVSIHPSIKDPAYSKLNGVVLALPASSFERPSVDALRTRQSQSVVDSEQLSRDV